MEMNLEQDVRSLIEQRDLKGLRQVIGGWTPAEIAYLIEELPPEEDAIVFRLLPSELATATFERLSGEKQTELVDALAHEKERLVSLLNDLAPDDRTALLEELPGPAAQRLLNLLSPEEHKVATMLLGYPQESIGRLMTPDYVAVRPFWTIHRVLEHVRRHGKDSETLNHVGLTQECRIHILWTAGRMPALPEACVSPTIFTWWTRTGACSTTCAFASCCWPIRSNVSTN